VLVRQRQEVQALPRRLTELLALLAFGIAAAGLVAAFAAFRVWQEGELDERRPVDAIVVLGAAQYDGRPSAVFAARLDHAVALYHEGLAPYLVVTGGRRPGDRLTEAETARRYARARGVPAHAILAEDEGRDTASSIRGVSRVLRDHDLRSALFVSDRMHMLRVLRIATDAGIESYGSPTATSPADATVEGRLRALTHELGGLAGYLLAGR
jgi:uncharacterized SAM-binding protein YcdF (DUF218 family)